MLIKIISRKMGLGMSTYNTDKDRVAEKCGMAAVLNLYFKKRVTYPVWTFIIIMHLLRDHQYVSFLFGHIDVLAPSFNSTCPQELVVDAEMGTTEAAVFFEAPVAQDNVRVANVSR